MLLCITLIIKILKIDIQRGLWTRQYLNNTELSPSKQLKKYYLKHFKDKKNTFYKNKNKLQK